MRLFSAALTRTITLASLALVSCVLEEPVFETGLARPGTALEGLWETTDANGNIQHAALFPLGEQTSLLQYPVATAGWWFQAQALPVEGRTLLQLRILAGPEATPARVGGKNYTLAWLEELPDGTVRMRALDGQAIEREKLTARSLRGLLSDPQTNWEMFFGAPSIFRRIPDERR